MSSRKIAAGLAALAIALPLIKPDPAEARRGRGFWPGIVAGALIGGALYGGTRYYRSYGYSPYYSGYGYYPSDYSYSPYYYSGYGYRSYRRCW